MKLNTIILGLFFLFFYHSALCQNAPISSIAFEGHTKTKEGVLLRNLQLKAGVDFDSTLLEQDMQSILNTQLFMDIDKRIENINDSIQITYILKEKMSILPLLNANIFEDVLNISVGAADYNFLGRQQQLSAIYTYYDRHSFDIHYDIPHAFYSNWGVGATFAKKSTNEPLYFGNDTPIEYFYDVYNYELRGRYTFNQNHFLQLAAAQINEDYALIGLKESEYPKALSLDKQLYKVFYKRDKVNYNYHYLDGWRYSLINDYVHTPSIDNWFWKIHGTVNYYKRIGQKSNWASRLIYGISKFEDSPFQPYVLDNAINLRGIGNRSRRGNTTFTFNTEYRYTLFENKAWALQGIGFVDIGSVYQGEYDFAKSFESTEVFTGIGLRFYSNKLINFLCRIDYGVNIQDMKQGGLIFGVGQYF